jgi:hypothetical protein
MTKAEKIRRAILKTPKAKAKEVAERLGVTVQDVYSARYLMKKQNKASGYPPLETPEENEFFKWIPPVGAVIGGFPLASVKQEGEPVGVGLHFDTTSEAKEDMVNHPPHYTVGGVETIDFIEAKGLNYHLGQVIKYVSRAGKKGDALQDLQKARWYLNREIARVE